MSSSSSTNGDLVGVETSELAAALAAITAEVGPVRERGRNPHHGYDYATFDDLLDVLRPVLVAHGVAIRMSTDPATPPVVEVGTSSGGGAMERWRVCYRFTISHAPSGEQAVDYWWGQAFDNSDKGATKAATSAHKHYLRHLFSISTGEGGVDPDADSPTREARAAAAAQDRAAEAPQTPAPTGQSSGPDWMSKDQLTVLERNGWGSPTKPEGAVTKAQRDALVRGKKDPGQAATWGEAQALLGAKR